MRRRSKELAAADQLSKPRHSMLYPVSSGGKQDSLPFSTRRTASSLRRSGIDSDNSINRDRLSLPQSEPGWRAFRRGPSPWIGVPSGWSNESRINRLTHQAEEKFLSVRDVLTNHNPLVQSTGSRAYASINSTDLFRISIVAMT